MRSIKFNVPTILVPLDRLRQGWEGVGAGFVSSRFRKKTLTRIINIGNIVERKYG